MSENNNLKEYLAQVRKTENDIYLMNCYEIKCREQVEKAENGIDMLDKNVLNNSKYYEVSKGSMISEKKYKPDISGFFFNGLFSGLGVKIILLIIVSIVTYFIASGIILSNVELAYGETEGAREFNQIINVVKNVDIILFVVMFFMSGMMGTKSYNEYKAEYEELQKVYDDAKLKKSVLQNSLQNAVDIANKFESSSALQNAKIILNDLYNHNIIFPKYRNIIVVNQISEYLDSGRCSELEGTYGAYNLYESELRQNIIIDKLETVINQLDQIKQNQYYIYQAMRDTQNAIENMNISVVSNTYIDGVRY